MSQENVEIVRRAFEESYATRSVENADEYASENFRYHMRPEWPGRPVYGRDEMPEIWADLDQTYSEFSLVPEKYEHLGPYVVVTLRISARLRDSAARVEEAVCHVWEVRDGRAVEAWAYGNKREALEAVGLSE